MFFDPSRMPVLQNSGAGLSAGKMRKGLGTKASLQNKHLPGLSYNIVLQLSDNILRHVW